MANRISAAGKFTQLASTRSYGVVLVQLGAGIGVKITPQRWHYEAAQVAVAVCGLLKQSGSVSDIVLITFQAHDEYQ